MALKWGDKLEHLEHKKYVSGCGGWSYGVVVASVGVREGETIRYRATVGFTQAQTKQMK